VRDPLEPAALDDFTLEPFTAQGSTRAIYRTGSGPAVIVIHEIPGITPPVAAFARKVAEHGMTAVLPSLVGTPGKPATTPYAIASMARTCVSREFATLATQTTSPITQWLRELARVEHQRCGGLGVGAVGMCFSGGFALGMMVDPVVVAPVLSQPSLPFALGKTRKSDLGLSPEDLEAVKARVAEGICVMGLRFTGDMAVPVERFARLRQELGENFIGVEIDSSADNPWGYSKRSHSVLSEHYSDAEGSPTRVALEQVLDFFGTRLGVS